MERSFLGIEFKKGEFLKIVENVPNIAPKNGWNIGDKVVAYFPLFKKDKMMVKDYNGSIIDIKKHESGDEKRNTYCIQYNDETKCDRVQYRYLFIPGILSLHFLFYDLYIYIIIYYNILALRHGKNM